MLFEMLKNLFSSRLSKAAVLLSFFALASCGSGGGSSVVAPVDPLTASPAIITVGDSTVLTVTFATGTAFIDNGIGNVTTGSTITVSPAVTTTYELTVIQSDGSSQKSDVTVTVVDAPAISSFSAAEPDITTGSSTTLTAVFSGGTANITGVGPVQSGVAITVTPSETTTYELIVTNAAGRAESFTAIVTVYAPGTAPPVSAPSISSFTASDILITAGGSVNLTAVFSDGTAVIDNGVGTVSSGVAKSVTPASTTTYKVTVTNTDAVSVAASVTVTVVAAPTISSFTASDLMITAGDSIDLTAVFSGGTALIDNGVGIVSSGIAASVSPASTTTYLVTVSNTAGSTVTASVTVSVVAAPVIDSFTVSDDLITEGEIINLIAVFSDGTAVIDNSVGSVTSASVQSVSPTVSTTYLLTVTNSLGAAVTGTVAVTVAPVPDITTIAADDPDLTVSPGDSVELTATFVNAEGGAIMDQGVGTVVSGVAKTVNPTTTTTYTLTITNAAGATDTASITITVQLPEPTVVPSIRPISDAQTISLSYIGTIDQGTLNIGGSMSGAAYTASWNTTNPVNPILTITPDSNWTPENKADLIVDVKDGNGDDYPTRTLTFDVLPGTLFFVNNEASEPGNTVGSDLNDGLTVSNAKLTINSAITAASSPATIVITSGSYQVDSSSANIALKDGVSLYGGYQYTYTSRNITRTPTVIEDITTSAGSAGSPGAAVLAGTGVSDATVVDGVTITGSSGAGVDHTAAVHIKSGSSVHIRNSQLYGGGNGGTESQAVFINASVPTLYNNLIHGGTAATSVGINHNGSADAVIRNNTIYSGAGTASFGIQTSSSPIIDNNIIFTNEAVTSACIAEDDISADPAKVRNNNLYLCGGAVFVDNDSACTGDADNDADNATCTLAEMEALGDMTASGNVSDNPVFFDTDGNDNNIDTMSDNDWSLFLSPVSVTTGGLNGIDDGLINGTWGFTTGFKDVDRPASGTGWSIGAYQYLP